VPRAAGRDIDDAALAHIWPTRHENVYFHGTHSVNVDSELAKLDADGTGRGIPVAVVAPAPESGPTGDQAQPDSFGPAARDGGRQ
jgi:hypothetical protein